MTSLGVVRSEEDGCHGNMGAAKGKGGHVCMRVLFDGFAAQNTETDPNRKPALKLKLALKKGHTHRNTPE